MSLLDPPTFTISYKEGLRDPGGTSFTSTRRFLRGRCSFSRSNARRELASQKARQHKTFSTWHPIIDSKMSFHDRGNNTYLNFSHLVSIFACIMMCYEKITADKQAEPARHH